MHTRSMDAAALAVYVVGTAVHSRTTSVRAVTRDTRSGSSRHQAAAAAATETQHTRAHRVAPDTPLMSDDGAGRTLHADRAAAAAT